MSGMLKGVLDWLQHNREWVFSGAGFALISGITGLVRWLGRPKAPDTTRAVSVMATDVVRVELGFGAFTYDVPPYLGDQMLMLKVANANHRPVKLAGIRLPLRGANMFFPGLEGERRLPCVIDPGADVKFWVPLEEIKAALRNRNYKSPAQICVIASDALDNEYASNSVTLPLAS
jgi:hypothetical protein